MKKYLRHLACGSVAGLLASSLQAAPFISIADTVDVFFLGKVATEYRSNLFNSTHKNDDFVFTFSPGLEARVGRNSNATVSLVYKQDFLVYHRFHGQNTNLANVILSGTYNSGPLKLDSGFSYRQTQSNTPDSFVPAFSANDMFVERDNYNAYITAKYDVSPKYWTKTSVRWSHTDYTNNQRFGNSFSNSQVISVPIDAYYRYSEKLSVGLGYRYRHTIADGNALRSRNSLNDHFISLALDGEITPKLNATANVGFQIRDDSGKTNNQFTVESKLVYDLSAKVNLFGGVDHDFGISSTGTSKQILSGHIGADYQINSFLSAVGRVEYQDTKYMGSATGRKDKTTYVNMSLNYSPNVYWTFSAGYGYSNNNSNVSAASFSSNIISLSASLRY